MGGCCAFVKQFEPLAMLIWLTGHQVWTQLQTLLQNTCVLFQTFWHTLGAQENSVPKEIVTLLHNRTMCRTSIDQNEGHNSVYTDLCWFITKLPMGLELCCGLMWWVTKAETQKVPQDYGLFFFFLLQRESEHPKNQLASLPLIDHIIVSGQAGNLLGPEWWLRSI